VRIILLLAFISSPFIYSSSNLLADDNATIKNTFSLEKGRKQGFFTYQIGGLVTDSAGATRLHFPLSELRFPLNVDTVQVSYLLQKSDWRLSMTYQENIDSDAGHMEDRDWGVNYLDDPNSGASLDSLDIYSESRSRLSSQEWSIEVDTKLQMKSVDAFLRLFPIHLGVGLLGQEYRYNTFDLVQSYPSAPLQQIDKVDGKVLSYRTKLLLPYISIEIEPQIHRSLNFNLKFMFSPLVQISDYDNHILRDKQSWGETDGLGFLMQMDLGWKMTSYFELFVLFNYEHVQSSGQQIQESLESGSLERFKVHLEHISEQYNAFAGARISF